MSERWSYKVLELELKLFGSSMSSRLEDELNRLGKQGWELVSMVQASSIEPIRCVLKKEN